MAATEPSPAYWGDKPNHLILDSTELSGYGCENELWPLENDKHGDFTGEDDDFLPMDWEVYDFLRQTHRMVG